MNPEDNPVHYCYGCQSCFAEMINWDELDPDEGHWDLTPGMLTEWPEYYNGFPEPFNPDLEDPA